jgi:hypothetical protein
VVGEAKLSVEGSVSSLRTLSQKFNVFTNWELSEPYCLDLMKKNYSYTYTEEMI